MNLKDATREEIFETLRNNGFETHGVREDVEGQTYLFKDFIPYTPDFSTLYGKLMFLKELAAKQAVSEEGSNRCEYMAFCLEGYAEPGYGSATLENDIVAFNNWNKITSYDSKTNKFTDLDDTPCRFGTVLEDLGVECEWEDEWTICSGCYKAIRTNPDSACWQPSYVGSEDGPYCHECVRKDPEAFMEEWVGRDTKCLCFDLDIESLGYRVLEKDFEHGFHPGQDAEPKVIGKSLRNLGISNYLFKLDHNDPFTTRFSVWVHIDDIQNLDLDAWNESSKDGPSVSQGVRRALQERLEG